MKLISFQNNKKRAVIESEDVGFYLYLFDLENGECTQDFLEDTLEFAKEKATEYGVTRESWKKI